MQESIQMVLIHGSPLKFKHIHIRLLRRCAKDTFTGLLSQGVYFNEVVVQTGSTVNNYKLRDFNAEKLEPGLIKQTAIYHNFLTTERRNRKLYTVPIKGTNVVN